MKADLGLLSLLRENGRESLTSLSKKLNVPISTLFDRLKATEHAGIIRRFTILPDYEKLGLSTRAYMVLKGSKDLKRKLQEYLCIHPHVNCVYKINNGYDFLVEVVFPRMAHLEGFAEEIEYCFKAKSCMVFYILETICEEKFMVPMRKEMKNGRLIPPKDSPPKDNPSQSPSQ